MRADICKPEDKQSVANLKLALAVIGAELVTSSLAFEVDLYVYRVGDETLSVFADGLSVEIEGPPVLVDRLLELVHPKPNEAQRPPG